jgi:hypothetical protein
MLFGEDGCVERDYSGQSQYAVFSECTFADQVCVSFARRADILDRSVADERVLNNLGEGCMLVLLATRGCRLDNEKGRRVRRADILPTRHSRCQLTGRG